MNTEILQGRRGRYQLLPGAPRSGGQAEVRRASAPDGRSVALKIARSGSAGWLERERTLLKTIHDRQPGGADWLVSLLDTGKTEDGRPFLVLPWYERTLDDWIDDEAPPLAARLDALISATEAVIHLHRSHPELDAVLMHRDIKPGNLLMVEEQPRPRVVLADLGCGKEGRLLTRSGGEALGTFDYAPPEQLLGLAPRPGEDIHALGVTIYRCFTGQVPTAVRARRGLYTDEAWRLLQLTERDSRRTTTEEAEYRRLKESGLAGLFPLDQAEPLREEDRQRLRFFLEQSLTDRPEDPQALACELAGWLLPALERALAPDPERRSEDARGLLAALKRCRERLETKEINTASAAEVTTLLAPEPPRPLPPPAAATPLPAAPARSLRRWGWALAGAGVMGMGLLVGTAAGVGYMFWPPENQPLPVDPGEVPPGEPLVSASSEPAPPAVVPASASEPPAALPPSRRPDPSPDPAPPEPAVTDPPPEESPPQPARIKVTQRGASDVKITLDGRIHEGNVLSLGAGLHRVKVDATGVPACEWTVEIRPSSASQWSVTFRPGGERTVEGGSELKAQCQEDGSLKVR